MPTGQLFIGGAWRPSVSGETYQTINPATEEPSATVARGDERDIDLAVAAARKAFDGGPWRSEEHTSELQSPVHLVCRLLLEKKKKVQHCANAGLSGPTGAGMITHLSSIVWVHRVSAATLRCDGFVASCLNRYRMVSLVWTYT